MLHFVHFHPLEEAPQPYTGLVPQKAFRLHFKIMKTLIFPDLNLKDIVHTARHVTKVGNTRSRWPNPWEGAVEGGTGDWDEVVTR